MKKIFLMIILPLLLLNISGCGKRDIDQLTTTTALGIDKTENGFKLTAQILNANAMGSKPREVTPVVSISEEGRTLQEAFRRMTTVFTSRLFYYHFQMLVFGEEAAKDGIEQYINFFAINNEAQHNFHIVIAYNDKAENILKVQTIVQYVPVLSFIGKIKADTENYGTSKITYMDELLMEIGQKKGGFALAGLKIIGDLEKGSQGENMKDVDPAAYVRTSNLAVFDNKSKLIGWLNERESIGYNHILNNIKSTYYVITKDDGNFVSVETDSIKVKVKAEIVNNKPKMIIDVKCVGIISEDMSGSTEFTIAYKKEIEEKTNYEIKKLIEETITKAKTLKCDFFSFNMVIYRAETKFWKTIEEDYLEIFPEIDVEINVKTLITRIKPELERINEKNSN